MSDLTPFWGWYWWVHTHTHTHTHMLGFHVLWGLSIDVMVFILYKLYILSPYTAPIPKPNHHRRHSAILHFQKTSLSLIYKLVSSWGPKNVPTRTRILDIAILVGTFCPHNIGFTWTISTFPPKNAHCMIYKRFKLWGHWKCPHKSPSPCNTYVIPMSLYKFVSS